MFTCVATKPITVTEEAYDSLKALKRSDESFSEALLRITEHRRDVWKGYGAMHGELDGVMDTIREDRERATRESSEKIERLFADETDAR